MITQLKLATIWRAEGRQLEAGVRRGFVGSTEIAKVIKFNLNRLSSLIDTDINPQSKNKEKLHPSTDDSQLFFKRCVAAGDRY